MGFKKPSIREIEESAPPVAAIEAKRRSLLYAMLNAVSDDDITDIVAGQVDKAKAGDARSARLILDMVQSGDTGDNPAPTHMQQAIVVNGDSSNNNRYLNGLQRNIVQFIKTHGPADALTIASSPQFSRDCVPMIRIVRALEHEWFEKEADGYHLTRKAMAEVCEPMDMGT